MYQNTMERDRQHASAIQLQGEDKQAREKHASRTNPSQHTSTQDLLLDHTFYEHTSTLAHTHTQAPLLDYNLDVHTKYAQAGHNVFCFASRC